AADAEKGRRHIPIGAGIALPNQPAGFEVEAKQFAFGAESVTAVGGEQRGAAGTVIVAVGIDEAARVTVAPGRFAVGGGKGFDQFVTGDPVVQDQQVTANGGRAIAGPNFAVPKQWGAVGWPGGEQPGFVGNAVGAGAEEPGPIFSQLGRLRAERGG